MDPKEPKNFIPLGIRRRLILLLAFCGLLALPACGGMDLEPLPTVAATADPLAVLNTPTPNADLQAVPLLPPVEQPTVTGGLIYQPMVDVMTPYLDENGNLARSFSFDDLKESVIAVLNSPEYLPYYNQAESVMPPQVSDSLVLLTFYDQNLNAFAHCSGVNYGSDPVTSSQFVLTSAHCFVFLDNAIQNGERTPDGLVTGVFNMDNFTVGRVHKPDGLQTSHINPVGNVVYDPERDVAMIRIPNELITNHENRPFLQLGKSNQVDPLYFSGHAYASSIPYSGSSLPGSGFNRKPDGYSQYLTSIGQYYKNMSGCGIFRPDGSLVGVLEQVDNNLGTPPYGVYAEVTTDMVTTMMNHFNQQ